ncbi:MAG: hypothetical protein K2I82_00670 [Ruminococcus sp.]|nr:hypothetical protein [Ruminococcus sp.]
MQDFQQQEEENAEEFTVGKAIRKAILMTFLVLTITFSVPMLWFIPAFNSHIKHSKLSGANANAATISKTANAALYDMDENEYFIGGSHVLCSEKKRNITDGTLNEDIFYEYMDKYFSEINFRWFVVIEEGKATYSAAQYASQKLTGSYPYRAVLDRGAAFYDGTYKSKKADLDDLYKYVHDNLNK